MCDCVNVKLKNDLEGVRDVRLKRALIATTVVQTFNVLSMVFGLVAVPLYLLWLGPERYGFLLTGLAFGGFLMFADVGLSWASMLLIAQAKGRNCMDEVSSIVSSSLILAGVSSCIVLIIVGTIYLFLTHNYSLPFFPSNEEFPDLFLVVGLATVISLAFSPFYNVFIGFQEGHLAALYQGFSRLLAIPASLITASTGASLGCILFANICCSFLMGSLAATHCVIRHPSAFSGRRFGQWDQFRKQLRTGIKSFAMQIGNVLVGSAPTLVISRVSGASFVPSFTIPWTLINTPLSLISSLNANMQASYGDALGANDYAWIGRTVVKLIRQTFYFYCFISVGFVATSKPFVQFWTADQLKLSYAMQLSVVGIAGCTIINSIFRFALSGMNRHRMAGISEIAFGVCAFIMSYMATSLLGADFVGLGFVLAYLSTGGWMLPLELSQILKTERLMPSPVYLIKIVFISLVSFSFAQVAAFFSEGDNKVFQVFVVGATVFFCFLCFSSMLLKEDFKTIGNQIWKCISFIQKTRSV